MNANAQDAPPPLLVKIKNKPGDPEWREVRARTVEMLPGFTLTGEGPRLSRFGGRMDRKVRATGFFRVEKIKDRWWMADPEGCLFFYVGVNSVAPGTSDTPRAALKEKFGDEKGWARAETKRLREMGFNGSGAWSDWNLLQAAVETPERLLYSTGPGEVGSGDRNRKGFMRSFAGKFNLTRPGVGHSLYPNDCMPVFHPEWEAFCDEYAKAYAATKDDPYLVGHFTDNELPTPRLEKYLGLKPDDPHMGSSYRAAKAWLDARKGRDASITDITDADRDAWMEHVFDRYFGATTRAIRKYDPNHLCFGSRLYSDERKSPGAMRAAGRHLDVIAINQYFVFDPNLQSFRQWTQWSGKPVMLTEWYAKGMDSGLPNTSGAGWTVPTQRDRGLFYQTFTLGLLESKNCVGWHWFKYLDNDPNDLKAEASNRDSNKGMMTIRYEPYAPLIESMRAVNGNVYRLADYFDR